MKIVPALVSLIRLTAIFSTGFIAVAYGEITPPAKHGEESNMALPYGLEAMERLDLLPFLPANGTQTKQYCTYDTSARNSYSVANFRRYEENGEWIFFDEKGPGCLHRMQMNLFKNTLFPSGKGRIRFYFDDETQPRIDLTCDEFFGKGGNYTAPFTPPLAFYDLGNAGGSKDSFANLYYPLPFGKRLKIALCLEGGMKLFECDFFQFTYVKYPPGTNVETWRGTKADSPQVRQMWKNCGQDPKRPLDGAQSIQKTANIPKGKEAMLLDLNGSGSLASLRLTMTPWNKDLFYNAILRITWDDHKNPAVEMPIGCLFGGGGDTIGEKDVSGDTLQTLMFGFDAKARQFYSYWPMPFWSRARIELINRSQTDIQELKLEASHHPAPVKQYPRQRCGYFFAKRTIDISQDNALWSRAFHVLGDGKVMGIMMYSHNYLEDGDELTYIDGSKNPQIHGDGTEDDHNQGWGGYALQKPCWGGLVTGFKGSYRLYLNDSYIFNREIAINYEHSLCQQVTKGQQTDSIVWYYLRDPGQCNLSLTDELHVADEASQKAHQYAITGQTCMLEELNNTISAYQGCEQGIPYPVRDRGRSFIGASSFTVKINPENEGVRLRRRLNRNVANVQEAKVFVDGQEIGTPWYFCDLPAPREAAFSDTDFDIPAAFTKGKEKISIRIEHVKALHAAPLIAEPQQPIGNNEYCYWVYSYGPAPLPAEFNDTVPVNKLEWK